MKEIPLTQGKVALVDDEDFEFLNQWKWYAFKNRKGFYAARKVWILELKKYKTVFMHNVLFNREPSRFEIVDHIDGNGLNNQKVSNLRLGTNSQNLQNRGKQNNKSSKFKGTTYSKSNKNWVSQINIGDKTGREVNKRRSLHLGSFKTEEEAARVYDIAAYKYHGNFAHLNFPSLIDFYENCTFFISFEKVKKRSDVMIVINRELLSFHQTVKRYSKVPIGTVYSRVNKLNWDIQVSIFKEWETPPIVEVIEI